MDRPKQHGVRRQPVQRRIDQGEMMRMTPCKQINAGCGLPHQFHSQAMVQQVAPHGFPSAHSFGSLDHSNLIRHSNFVIRISGARRAFSFIEVLFAVILLGIGFIMIAGIFPVAIQQSAASANENEGTLVCRDAMSMIQSVAATPTSLTGGTIFPISTNGTTTGVLQAFTPTQTNALGPGAFFTADKRYGWVGFYSRDSNTSPYAQFTIVALHNEDFPEYNGQLPIFPSTPSTATPPFGTVYTIQSDPTDPTQIIITGGPAGPSSAVTGAFVLIQFATPTAGSAYNPLNGRILRLGTDVGGGKFQLQPGFDLDAGAGTPQSIPINTTAYIIGRAPTGKVGVWYTPPYTGPLQDIAVMTAYLPVCTTN
jgi:type II secretory pathway pseudopilin PulG